MERKQFLARASRGEAMDSIEPSPAASPHVLEYGREGGRLRRFRRIAIILLILASIVGVVWFAIPQVIHTIELRKAVPQCNSWAATARTSLLPNGTLLYSQAQEDFRFAPINMSTIGATEVRFAPLYPELRELAYRAGGIPILSDFRNIVYVHEHPLWLSPKGSLPPLFSVFYIGTDVAGNPQFGVSARMFPLDSNGRSNMVGGISTSPPPGRPLVNLRLFAGQPDPADPTRFHVPFSCDAGAGRFEFQTDTDASDGGDIVPKLTITWDAPPTTRPR